MINQEALAKAIKPLVWTPYESANGAHASSVVGNHEVHHFDGWGWRTSADYWEFHRTETEGEAKAAAQADYVARILSAFNLEALPHLDRAGVLEEAFDKAIGLVSVDISFALDAIRQKRQTTAPELLAGLSSLRDSIRREKMRALFPDAGAEDLTDMVRAMPHPVIPPDAANTALAQPAVNTSPEGVGGTHIGIKEAIELSLGGLPPAQIENLHFFRNDAPAPYDSPAVKAMARELLAFRKICFAPSPTDERSK